MEIEKSLNLSRKELADLLRNIAGQLEREGPVRSESLNAEVNPAEPVLVKFEYEDKVGEKEIEINIHLVERGQPSTSPTQF